MSAGFFVVLEGPEGAGKTTLAAALADWLRGHRVDPVMVRQPGGTPLAEALREQMLDTDREWTPELELLYVITARADVVSRVIRPALTAGRVVISDRYDLSTRAYQGAGRGLPLALYVDYHSFFFTSQPDALTQLGWALRFYEVSGLVHAS